MALSNNWAFMKGRSDGTIPTNPASANVTITGINVNLINPTASGQYAWGISATYTVPGGWTGTKVHGGYEFPDRSSGAAFALDGTAPLDGTASLAGPWKLDGDIGDQLYNATTGGVFYFEVPCPKYAMVLRLRLSAANANSDPAITQSTPSITITLGPPNANVSGTKNTSNITLISPVAGSSNTLVDDGGAHNGIHRSPLTVSYTEPADPSYGGVSFELVYDNLSLTGETFAFNAGHKDPVTLPFATPAAINTGTVFCVAYDVNGNSNGKVLGVTPSFQVILGTTSGTIGSDTTSVFIPSIRPVTIGTPTLPTLPSALYPPGTFGADMSGATPALRRVNAAGTAWEALIGAGDLQANSVTAGVAAFGAIAASSLGSGTFPVGVIYAGTVYLTQLGSGTLPVGVIYAGNVNVSQLVAGSASFSGTVTLANGSNSVVISSSGVAITGGTLVETTTSGATTVTTKVANNVGFGAGGTLIGGVQVSDGTNKLTIVPGGFQLDGTSFMTSPGLFAGGSGFTFACDIIQSSQLSAATFELVQTKATSATAGVASALPSAPAGYLVVKDITGTSYKFAVYNL